MRNILVTGGAGFIGSNFVRYALKKSDYLIVNLDALTYSGSLENLSDIENLANYVFIKGDINNKTLVSNIFKRFQIDTVVNFAAESHVDRSIENPDIFVRTNILGTQNLLEIAKQHWKIIPDDKYSTTYRNGVKFLQISTDEVYGALGETGLFTENTPIAPNSPYAASKAAADLIVRSYSHTFNLPINITRCSNNYGPYQFPEKFIPLMITNALKNKPLPIYGDGQQIRDWLYVEDHCTAIWTVLKLGYQGEVYNIGGNNEWANIDIVRLLLARLEKHDSLICYVPDRLGHDRRYAIDNSKIKKLGWTPKWSFKYGISRTVDWYIENKKWIERINSTS